MDDPRSRTQEQLHAWHTEERLQSSPTDRMEAWGIVLAIPLSALCYGSWGDVPVAAAVSGVLAAILVLSTFISWARRKLFKRHRETEG